MTDPHATERADAQGALALLTNGARLAHLPAADHERLAAASQHLQGMLLRLYPLPSAPAAEQDDRA